MDNENPPENGTWLKRVIVGVYFLAVVILIPFFIWPLVQNGTHNPKMEAMVISTVFLVLTLPISIYSVASHLGKFFEIITMGRKACQGSNFLIKKLNKCFLTSNMIYSFLK